MTADATALVRAVLESPADDAPRLVFADYVEEQGDPGRAEFIRLQVAAAHESCAQRLPRQHTCSDVACRRCRPYGDRLAALCELPGFGGWVWDGWEAPVVHVWFDRGFVEGVSVVAERFAEVAGRLFALEPIRSVRLTGRMPALTPSGATWYSEGQVSLSATARTAAIPKAVYELMRSRWLAPRRLGRWETQVYPTHSDANDALSEACVRFGRREAGLLK
jgi:uncharacterized protein (TIGR02996 family)